VAIVVTQIKDGTFERKSRDILESNRIEQEFRRITHDFYSELRSYSASGDAESLKVASGLYINMLEELFRQIEA